MKKTADMAVIPGRFALVFFTPKDTLEYAALLRNPGEGFQRSYSEFVGEELEKRKNENEVASAKQSMYRRGKRKRLGS